MLKVVFGYFNMVNFSNINFFSYDESLKYLEKAYELEKSLKKGKVKVICLVY